jgi:hypothetical protein
MTPSRPALVYWSAEKQNNLPTSGQYITVARFPEDTSASEAWSIVLDIKGDVKARPCRAEARFLMQNAPHKRLKPGVRFELLQGNKGTATVEVV